MGALNITGIEGAVGCESSESILPDRIECREKTIAIDLHLVQIDGAIQLAALVPNVRNRHRAVPPDFALNAQIPLLHVRGAKVRIHSISVADPRVKIVEVGPIP